MTFRVDVFLSFKKMFNYLRLGGLVTVSCVGSKQ